MTEEELIKDAAYNYMFDTDNSIEDVAAEAFIAGAEWYKQYQFELEYGADVKEPEWKSWYKDTITGFIWKPKQTYGPVSHYTSPSTHNLVTKEELDEAVAAGYIIPYNRPETKIIQMKPNHDNRA